jgi:hypothetical protein
LQRRLETVHLASDVKRAGQEHEQCLLEFAPGAKQR